MASQIFVYDNRTGSTLIFQLACQSGNATKDMLDAAPQKFYVPILNAIIAELQNGASTLVQVTITKG